MSATLVSLRKTIDDTHGLLSTDSGLGYGVEDALANLKEATELYLEEFPLKDGPPAFLTTFEAKCA